MVASWPAQYLRTAGKILSNPGPIHVSICFSWSLTWCSVMVGSNEQVVCCVWLLLTDWLWGFSMWVKNLFNSSGGLSQGRCELVLFCIPARHFISDHARFGSFCHPLLDFLIVLLLTFDDVASEFVTQIVIGLQVTGFIRFLLIVYGIRVSL